jgi:hypothetical protein
VKQAPIIIHAEELRSGSFPTKEWNGVWTAARPLSGGGLRDRFRYAWMVFTGRADALVWFNDGWAGRESDFEAFRRRRGMEA